MNNENQFNESNSSGVYKVSGNLNVAIDNPNMDVDSATGVNMQNSAVDINSAGFNNSFNSSNMSVSNNIQDNSNNSSNSTNNYNPSLNNNSNNYNPSFDNSSNNYNDGTSFDNSSNINNPLNVNNNVNNNENTNTTNYSTPQSVWMGNDSYVDNSSENVNYEPVYEKKEIKKDSKDGGVFSKELKLTIVVAFLLFIFILLLDPLYDAFRKLILWFVNNFS